MSESEDDMTVPPIDAEREPTHRVVNKVYRRAYGSGETARPHVVRFEVGDEIAPTPHELENHGDRFEPLPETDAEAPEPESETEEEPDAEPETADEPDAEAEAEPEGIPDDVTTAWVEDADYDDLRTVAKDYEEINGNWGEDRLRLELAEAVENE